MMIVIKLLVIVAKLHLLASSPTMIVNNHPQTSDI